MNFIKTIKNFLILFFAVVIGMQVVCANGLFTNNLLKVDVSESPSNVLNVKLYTSKPYKETVKIILKGDPEYIILLPETSSSPNIKPSLKGLSKNVQSIDIKTQQYTDQLKGYTKITITTINPVDIIVQKETSDLKTLAKLEKDKSVLTKQETTKNVTTKSAPAKTLPSPKNKVITVKKPPKPEVKTYTTKVASAPVKKTIQQIAPTPKTIVTKPASKKVLYSSKFKPTTVQTIPSAQKQIINQQKVKPLPVKKEVTQKIDLPKQQAAKTEVTKPEVVKSETVKTLPQPAEKVAVKNKISTPEAPAVTKVSQPKILEPKVVTPEPKIEKVETYKTKIKNIVMNNKPIAYGTLALIPIILLLILLKRLRNIVKNVKQKNAPEGKFKKAAIDEPEQTVDQEVDFPTFLNEPEQTQDFKSELEQGFEQILELEEKFEKIDETFQEEAITPGQSNEEIFDELISEPLPEDEIYNDDMGTGFPEELIEEPQAEFEEEPQATFEEEPQVEEILEIPETSEVELAPELEPEPEPEDDFSSLNELNEILQEDKPTEEVSIEDLLKEDEEPVDIEIQSYTETSVFEVDFENQEPQAEKFESPIEESQEEPDLVEASLDAPESKDAEGAEEIIKSEFVIDEDKGFYLVDFEDASALVGHIEDEIFVLKKFDEKVHAKLQARLNETKQTASSYMTKVGNFKALVEVTPDDMKLLIEL